MTDMDKMMIEDEALARFFHETYERLAPQFSYETRKASAVPWENVPESNRKLMIATAHEVRTAYNPDDRLMEALEAIAWHHRHAHEMQDIARSALSRLPQGDG